MEDRTLESDEEMDYCVRYDEIRWVGYFDLLGVSRLINSGKTRQVLYDYREAVKTLDTFKRRYPDMRHVWFSDSFLVYSPDASCESFAAMELVCRWFMTALLGHCIPVVGSISCGRLYCDEAHSLYVGPALVEAVRWQEGQNWIGLVLCPSCITRLGELNQSTRDYKHYVEVPNPPFLKPPLNASRPCTVCILDNWIREGDSGPPACLSNLRRMRDMQEDKTIVAKYEQTIAFIEEYQEDRGAPPQSPHSA